MCLRGQSLLQLGINVVGRLLRGNDLLLCTDHTEGSRNSLCATLHCLQQSLSFDIVLSSWDLDFPKVTYTAASVGVSWYLSVLTRPLVCLREAHL